MEMVLRDSFLDMKMVESEDSYKSYISGINCFYKDIEEVKEKKYDTDEDLIIDISVRDYERYYKNLIKKNKKSTVNSRLNITKQLFEYAVDSNIIEKNPTKTAKPFSSTKVEAETTKKEILTVDEIKKVLNCSYIKIKYEKNFDVNSVRDRCLIAILVTGGLRISEALNIKISDIEETQLGTVIKINDTKNNVAKRVPITKGIEVYFREYVNMLLVDGYKEGYLFFTKSGNQMEYSDAKKLIDKAIKKAGIDKKITTHSFRYSLTQILLEKEVNESMIYKILGWKETKMISKYSGSAADQRYDEIKFKHCDILS